MNSKLIVTATVLVGLLSILFIAVKEPVRYQLIAPKPINGARDALQDAEIISLNGAVGPESLAFDAKGDGPYTGVADGRILKWEQGQGWVEYAVTSPDREDCVRPFAPEMEHVCGRPLGLRFHSKTGDLYVADAYFGLQKVALGGGLATQIITKAENISFTFSNDLDIDEIEDVIYFTDTSTNFQRRQFATSVWSGDKTGRLIKYNLRTQEVEVLLRNLAFANGVALSKDRSFVLVAETTSCRIVRFWLKGPRAGKSDVFAKLPGFPDNIRRNSAGEFWVALHSKVGPIGRFLLSHPSIAKCLTKFPVSLRQMQVFLTGGKVHATAMKLNQEGRVIEVLEDSEGRTIKLISEVEEKNGKLWIGSVLVPFVGYYNLNRSE